MSTVIVVENLSKKYIISHQKRERYTTLRDVLTNGAKRFTHKLAHPFATPKNDATHEEFWALKNINFEIQQGDRVGIIGRNGAGKSTLLKVLSRITEPTSGKVSIKGRVASLLEVGTGFHPELTGRENIYLNGAILGMSKAEIRKKFDEIVAFAETEKFLDTPVKRYSSGMYVRLAFAVAAHLEPEILIVDEVLAVGDAQFQKKCLGKMEEVGRGGRTVLFVSHNMIALKSLCEKAIWLDAGGVVKNGIAEDVCSNYQQNGVQARLQQVWNDPKSAPGNDSVRLRSAKVSYEGEASGEKMTVASSIDLEFAFWNYEPNAFLNFSLVLYDNQNICIFNTVSSAKVYPKGVVKGTCHIPGNFLNDGIYRVRLLIVKEMSKAIIDVEDVAMFEVHDVVRERAWFGKWLGAVRPTFKWDTMATSD
ncbi:MAG: polysaccharide ABC transporter ATP-binding protein [Gallionella sp.]